MMNRRDFLKLALGTSVCALVPLGAGRSHAFSGMGSLSDRERERFFFAQLRYRGGDWDPDPTAAPSLLDEVARRTSVMVSRERKDLQALSPDLFSYPMLYMTGHYEFEPFSEEEIQRLRDYLDYGGFLVADDCAGHSDFGFDRAFRREVARLYPGNELEKLSREHPVFKSFYLVRTVGGRRLVSPYLEGITVGSRTPVIYCRNDIGCALERDELGGWVHPCLPGGERQRQHAFQLGVNLVMYALCQDYKSDKIHIPFLRQRI